MAEYQATCPGCKATIRFKKARTEIKCPRCQTQFAIPAQAAEQSPMPQAPFQQPANPQPQFQATPAPLQQSPQLAAWPNPDPRNAAGIPGPAQANPFADQNPYQSPMTPEAHGMAYQASPNGGIWRQGNVLVMHKNAVLPNICLKSNQPATERLKLKYQWHNPLLALAILINLIIYVILAMVLSKKALLDIPLTSEWVKKRRMRIAITWLLSFACLGCIFVGIAMLANESETIGALLMLSSLVLFFVAIFYGSALATLFKPTRITDTHVWLKGVNREFLNALPDWTG